jgi:biotin carboxyl carrier protein
MTKKVKGETGKTNVKEKVNIADNPMFRHMIIEGTKYRTLTTRKNELRTKWVAPQLKELKSFIPGTIIKVSVKPGDRVEPGDLLLVFEAMKMMNQVLSPFPGIIKKVFVKEGDKVPKGSVLIDYE